MSEDSDYDPQTDERHVQALQDRVSLLEKENEVLKSQFDQAVQMTSQMKALRQKNEELSQSVRSLTRENDDLNHRFEILNKTNEENAERMMADRKRDQDQRKADGENAQAEIDRIKSVFSKQIDELQKKVNEETAQKEQLDTKLKKMTSDNQKMFESASFSLKEEISSIEQLSAYFEKSQEVHEKKQSSPKKEAQATPKKQELFASRSISAKDVTDGDELKRKIKMYQNKARAMQETIANLELQANQANKALKDSESKCSIQAQEYEHKIKALAEESQLVQQDQQHQISVLSNKVETLKSDIQKTRSLRESTMISFQNQTPSMMSPQQTPIKNKSQKETEFSTMDRSIKKEKKSPNQRSSFREDKSDISLAFDQMTLRNSELSQQLQTVSAKKDELTDQLSKAQHDRQELELNAEKQKHSINVLTAVHNETVAELETIRQALTTLSPIKERSAKATAQKNKETTVLRSKISDLEKTIEIQKESISNANVESANAKQELAHLTSHTNSLESELKKYDEQIRKLNIAVSDAEHKYQTKPTITEEDLIPMSAWRYPGFDLNLVLKIMEVAQNQSLQTATKLQVVFKTIGDYYNEIVSKQENGCKTATNEMNAFKGKVDKFLVDISIAATGVPTTVEDFMKNDGSDLVKIISSIRHSLDDIKRRYNSLQNIIDQYRETFGNESDEDISASIQTLKNTLDTRSNELEGRNKRVRDLKTVLDQYQKKSIMENQQLTDENDTLKHNLDELRSKFNTSRDEVTTLKRRNQELTQQLREARESNENLQTTMIEEQDEAAQNAANELTRLDQTLREEIRATEQKLSQTSEELEDASSEVEKLKAIIVSQKKTIESNKTQAENDKESFNQTIQSNEMKYASEKEHIIQTYEEALAEIKKQNEERRSDITRLTEDLKQHDTSLKEVSKKLNQVKREKKMAEEDLKLSKENFERQLRLAESKNLAEIMQLETNYSTRSNEQIEQFEREKCDIFRFAATEFKQYFVPGESINERSYKALIGKAHSELDRLSKSDASIRRITCAAERQTTEDAVMQLRLH